MDPNGIVGETPFENGDMFKSDRTALRGHRENRQSRADLIKGSTCGFADRVTEGFERLHDMIP